MTLVKKINYSEDRNEIISKLKDKELLVYEDIQGSTIYVQWSGHKFTIKPKSLRNEPLNFIDLVTQKFYNSAFEYFNKLPSYVTELLNKNWWFCFEFFPDNQPANIEYDRLPKNNLILKCIVKGTKYKYNYDELEEYSNLFKTDVLPVIFKGTLSSEQLDKIQLFLNTSKEDLSYVFGEDNFAKYLYNLLNPQLDNSYLMDNSFNENIQKIFIKIVGEDDLSFEILNPLYQRLEHNNTTEFVDMYSLILVNFMEFCQLQNLSTIKLKELTKDDLYLELMSIIFNEYIDNIRDSLDSWIIDIPPFFQDDKFKININFVKNKLTTEYIKSDPKIEYLFKCILGSFSKSKKKPIGIFNEQTLNLFNKLVKDIDNILNNKLNINREYQYQKSDIKNFKDFWDLKYNTDAKGNVYPDVYDMYDEIESGDKKKKGSKKKGFEDEGFEEPSGETKPEKPGFEIQKERL